MPWKRWKKSISNIQISLRLLFVKLIITKGNDITNDIPNIMVNIIANIIHECSYFFSYFHNKILFDLTSCTFHIIVFGFCVLCLYLKLGLPCHLEFLLFWYFLCSWQMVWFQLVVTWMFFITCNCWFFMNNYKNTFYLYLIAHDAYNYKT
jgi:hypothetical protein